MKVKPIRKFSIDYRRYLGAVVLFVVLVLVLAKCTGPVERVEKPDNTEENSSEVESGNSTQAPQNLDGEISKSTDAELVSLVKDVYRAYVDNDVVALETHYSLLSDNEKSYIAAFAEYKEEYRNVECYALKLDEDEYFVSPCYDLKFYGAETSAPGMDFFYVQRNDAGRLYINSAYTTYNFNFMEQELDAGIYAKILAYNRRDEITDLQQTIQASYDAAVAGDENLANLIGGTLRNAMIQWQNKISSGTEDNTEPDTQDPGEDTETPTEVENTEDTENPPENSEPESETPPEPPKPTTYQVRVRVNCNIREEASKNSERIGHAELGDLFTAISTDGEWTKIEYRGGYGYIRNDLIRTVE